MTPIRAVTSLFAIALAASASPLSAAPGFADVLDTPARTTPLASKSLFQAVTRAGDRLVAVGQRGHVVVSTDGGKSWKQSAVPVSSDLTAVYFVDANTRLGRRPRRRGPAHERRRRVVAVAARRPQGERAAARSDEAQGRRRAGVRRGEAAARGKRALQRAGSRQAVPRRLVRRCEPRLRGRRVQPDLPNGRRRQDAGRRGSTAPTTPNSSTFTRSVRPPANCTLPARAA